VIATLEEEEEVSRGGDSVDGGGKVALLSVAGRG
jgi:hypothetical protein